MISKSQLFSIISEKLRTKNVYKMPVKKEREKNVCRTREKRVTRNGVRRERASHVIARRELPEME